QRRRLAEPRQPGPDSRRELLDPRRRLDRVRAKGRERGVEVAERDPGLLEGRRQLVEGRGGGGLLGGERAPRRATVGGIILKVGPVGRPEGAEDLVELDGARGAAQRDRPSARELGPPWAAGREVQEEVALEEQPRPDRHLGVGADWPAGVGDRERNLVGVPL